MNSLVLPAWEMVNQFLSLKKFNFIPSLIGTLWLFVILIYQTIFSYVYIFHQKDRFFEWLGDIATKTHVTEVLLGLGFLFLLHIVIVPLAEGGLIEMIHGYRSSHGDRQMWSYEGLFRGMRHYLPLFEIANLIGIFKPLSIITFYILLLRVFGKEFLAPISLVMGIYLLFAFFLNMCFSYSKYFIIFEGKSALEAITASTSMALLHIGVTMKLYSTMLFVYLRTILTALFFLGIPFIISGIITYFTMLEVQILFLTIFGGVSVLLFLIITHLGSTLDIFVEATWYEAYQLNKSSDIAEGRVETAHHDTHHHESHHDDRGHHHIQMT